MSLSAPRAAQAQAKGPQFGLKPALAGKTTLESGHYQYAVKAGAAIEDGVIVYNFTPEELTLKLYAADVITPKGGGVTPVDAQQDMHEVGAWVTLERDEVTIPADGEAFVAFAVRVPAEIPPGDHLGAVVASRDVAATPGSIAVEQRVALIARVRIPGDPRLDSAIGPLRITERGRERDFRIELHNTGNLLFTTKGSVDIMDGQRRVATVPLQPEEVYVIPGGKATFGGTWAQAPLFGSRTAVASFDTRAKGVSFKRLASAPVDVRTAPPLWLLAVGSLAVVVLVAFVLNRTFRGRRRSAAIDRSAHRTRLRT